MTLRKITKYICASMGKMWKVVISYKHFYFNNMANYLTAGNDVQRISQTDILRQWPIESYFAFFLKLNYNIHNHQISNEMLKQIKNWILFDKQKSTKTREQSVLFTFCFIHFTFIEKKTSYFECYTESI